MIWVKTLVRLVLVLVGAVDIGRAIDVFNKGYYSMTGFYIMMAVWMTVILFDTYTL